MPEWWRRAVVYEIYIRSFADANGDGVGDIDGIRSRLPYLRDLGIDAIWVTPWYRSPMVDAGYDVADHRAIDPLFGTLDDARAMVDEAHEHGIRVLVDIVPNHTSSAHPWFRAALAAGPSSPERARYWFRPGRGPGGTLPPNNWMAVFGGPAWDRLPDGDWYLHLFDPAQPDLDWDHPDVRADFLETLRFWLDIGVDGFRIDVAHFLAKDRSLPDVSGWAHPTADDAHPFADREAVHDIYRSWRNLLDQAGRSITTCAEIDLPADRVARYLRPGELHTSFNFDLLHRPWRAGPMRRSIERTLASHAAVGAPPSWVLGNHDVPRPTYRLGRDETAEDVNPWTRRAASDQVLGLRRARAAALLALALPGVAYIWQGDELGLPEVLDLPAEARRDPTYRLTGGAEVGRDGDRIPIPWSGSAPPYGFGPEGSMPWLPQPPTWSGLSVEAQSADASSTLALYRAALALRRTHPGLAGDGFAWVDGVAGPDDLLHFERDDGFRCLVNLGRAPVDLPDGARILLRSDAPGDGLPTDRLLPPHAAAWYHRTISG